MKEIQVHPAGTVVAIDRENHRIGTIYPNQINKAEPMQGWQDTRGEWFNKFSHCAECKAELDDERTARAFWAMDFFPLCGTECFQARELRKHACCSKATRMNCVCAMATTCPEHGERHYGTHD